MQKANLPIRFYFTNLRCYFLMVHTLYKCTYLSCGNRTFLWKSYELSLLNTDFLYFAFDTDIRVFIIVWNANFFDSSLSYIAIVSLFFIIHCESFHVI